MMKHIPNTQDALVLRTDFSDDVAWDALCLAIQKPDAEFGFQACVDFVSDPEYKDITSEQILSLLPGGWQHSFIFIVDHITFSHPEQPILVVDLYLARGRTFRVIPAQMWGVENNLSLANMDFAEFADAVEIDGIFRGYSES